MKKLLIIVSCILLTIACQQNDEEYTLSENSQTAELSALEHFSLLLSKAVASNSELRTFLKKEALEMIDNDYDVFYPLAKNKIVTEGKTFKNILEQYDSNKELDELERKLPLLTVMIPELPSGYNAETWNCTEEVPHITPRLGNKCVIPYYKDGMTDFEFDANLIPGFPVLVVKNNERIVRNTGATRTTNASTLNSEYSFVDAAFDRSCNTPPQALTRTTISGRADLETAYRAMGATSEKWQRDNIYYGLTPTNTEGPLKRNYAERIEAIRFTEQAYTKMCDQDDPRYDTSYFGMHACAKEHPLPDATKLWQDGRFEFKIDITINNQAGLGTNITKFFSVNPSEIYDIVLESKRIGKAVHHYRAIGVSPKTYYSNINLVTWDLEQNSFSWKITVAEVDDQETYTTQETISSEFATNFSVNTQGGTDKIKVGLNFGMSTKSTKQTQFTRVTYKNSDDLGTLEANFSDPILLNSSNELYFIKNPMVELALVPAKLY